VLYDLLVKAELLDEEKIPKFDGTHYSDYLFFENDKEYWHLGKDFENCIPPYDKFWIEFRAPKAIVSKEKGTNLWDLKVRPSQWGWLITHSFGAAAEEVKDHEELNKTHLLSGRIFQKFRNGRMNVSKYVLHMLVNKEGRIIDFPTYDKNVLLSGPRDLITQKQASDLINDLGVLFQPALLTISSLCNLDGNHRGMLV
jgi:hypothetical protein